MSPARCASTRRCGICWIAITAWSRRRRRKHWLPRSSSALSSGRLERGDARPPTGAHRGDRRSGEPAGPRDVAARSTRCARPRCAWCCGRSRCTASTAITSISCRASACIWRRRWCASANGAVIDRPNPRRLALPSSDSAPQYCIETTAYQAGTEINMVMVLRDETTGIYVWSESFRLGLDNWFEAQQRIIRRIATSLNVQLSAERLMRLAGEPDVSLDIHDRWLRGQSLMAKFDPESWQRAVTIFRDAIRENPDVLAVLQQPRADEQYRAYRASRRSSAISTRQERRSNWRRPPFNWIRSIPGRICAAAGRM